MRADDRISDVPALNDLGVPDPVWYTEVVARGWDDETLFVWAVCIPTTGELVAVIGVTPAGDSGRLWGRARSGHADALDAAVGPVTRFAAGALNLPTGDTLVDDIGGS